MWAQERYLTFPSWLAMNISLSFSSRCFAILSQRSEYVRFFSCSLTRDTFLVSIMDGS